MFGLSDLFGSSINKDNYYYGRLTEEQKAIYEKLQSGIKTFADEIKLPFIPMNETSKIFDYVLLDNPLFFYASSFSQSNDLYKKKSIIKPGYKYARKMVRQNNDIVMNYLQKFDALKTKSGIEKETYVHDYCLDNFVYDYSFGDYSNSILGTVLNKTAVCEGIAKFVKLAFDYLGVKSLVVRGKAKNPAMEDSVNEMHAWNIVIIDGKTYHLDVTFDMTLKSGKNRYDYFNLSDEDIKKDHIIIDSVPACTTTGKDYFSVNSSLVHNPAELGTFIGNNLKKGKKHIMVKLVNVRNAENIAEKIMKIAQKQYAGIYTSGVTVEIGCNTNQMVFEINFK